MILFSLNIGKWSLFSISLGGSGPMEHQLARILAKQTENTEMLEEIVREVAESRSVTESAIAFIKGLQDKIATLSTSGLEVEALKAQLAQLAAELDAQQSNLSAAMVTGTVADPTQPPPDNGVEAAPNVESVPPPAEAVTEAAEEVAAAVENAQPPNV